MFPAPPKLNNKELSERVDSPILPVTWLGYFFDHSIDLFCHPKSQYCLQFYRCRFVDDFFDALFFFHLASHSLRILATLRNKWLTYIEVQLTSVNITNIRCRMTSLYCHCLLPHTLYTYVCIFTKKSTEKFRVTQRVMKRAMLGNCHTEVEMGRSFTMHGDPIWTTNLGAVHPKDGWTISDKTWLDAKGTWSPSMEVAYVRNWTTNGWRWWLSL